MSLNLALNSALTSLLAIERQMAVASSNISNASVDGYTSKSVQLTTQVTGGEGAGVDISGLTSAVNQYLLKDIANAKSTSAADTTTESYYSSLQSLLGTVSSSNTGDDLSSLVTNLATSLQNLVSTPDDNSLKTQVVSDLDSLTSKLRSMSSGIQALRTQADQEIGDSITDVNKALDTVKDLNDAIVTAQARGEPTVDLEDQRNTALQTISSNIDINYYTDSQNQVHIYTAQNQALLDGAAANHLSHNTAAAIADGVTYSASSTGGISGIYAGGVDITGQISGGKIGALIEMRDAILPNAQAELNSLATTLGSTLNALSNQGSASPPPANLTGTTAIAATDTVTMGSSTVVRLAQTDTSGKITSYQDLDLSSATTVQDVLDSLNAVSGITAGISGGVLSIGSTSGVAVTTLSGSVDGTDFSSAFGLNDLVTGSGSAATIAVRSTLQTTAAGLPTGKLSQSTTLTVGDTAIGASDASIPTALYDALTASRNFSAAGWLGSTTTTFAQYAANIISGVATLASTSSTSASTSSAALSALQTSFSSQSGVNTDEQTALLSELENQYAAAAKVISTANAMFDSLISAVAS